MCDSDKKEVNATFFEAIGCKVRAMQHTPQNTNLLVEWLKEEGALLTYKGDMTLIFAQRDGLCAVPYQSYLVQKEDGTFFALNEHSFQALFNPVKENG